MLEGGDGPAQGSALVMRGSFKRGEAIMAGAMSRKTNTFIVPDTIRILDKEKSF